MGAGLHYTVRLTLPSTLDEIVALPCRSGLPLSELPTWLDCFMTYLRWDGQGSDEFRGQRRRLCQLYRVSFTGSRGFIISIRILHMSLCTIIWTASSVPHYPDTTACGMNISKNHVRYVFWYKRFKPSGLKTPSQENYFLVITRAGTIGVKKTSRSSRGATNWT